MGLGRALARSGAARAKAALRDAAGAGAQLLRVVHRLHRRIKAYAVVDLRVMGTYDWRLSTKNVWKVEQMLLDWPHRRIASSDRKADAMRRRYRAFREAHGYKPWKYYKGRERWTAAAAGIRATRLMGATADRGITSKASSERDSRARSQSRSKSRTGLVTGSCFAFFSASSNLRVRASSRAFSASTDCSNSDSRRAASAARIRAASFSSGLSPRSGSRCD